MGGLSIAKPIVKITKNGLKFLSKNSNMVLTIVGVTGVIATVYCAVTGTIKAVKLCEEKQVKNRKEVIRTVWKCYIPTVGIAILTTTAIVCNGRINAKKIAVLTSAYSGSVEALKKVEEKMGETIGPKKTQAAIDSAQADIAKEHMPKDEKEVLRTGKGDRLFYCSTTGQWFYSDIPSIERDELKFQNFFNEKKTEWGGEFVMVAEAQEALGLPVTEMGEMMGWYTSDFPSKNECPRFIISSDIMEFPWGGRAVVGVLRITPWPSNM